MIALMISDITNPFYFEIIRGAQAAAAEAGYTMLLADAQESDVLEREALDRALPTVEGIVLASTRMSDSAIRMTAKQRPMIVLNRAVADVPSVVTDNPRGTRRAAEHLADLGHHTITYVAGPEASWADGIRWRSLREAAADLGLHARRMGPYPPTVAGGEQAGRRPGPQTHDRDPGLQRPDWPSASSGVRRRSGRRSRRRQHHRLRQHLRRRSVTPRLTTVAAPLHALGGDRRAQPAGHHQRRTLPRQRSDRAPDPTGGACLHDPTKPRRAMTPTGRKSAN